MFLCVTAHYVYFQHDYLFCLIQYNTVIVIIVTRMTTTITDTAIKIPIRCVVMNGVCDSELRQGVVIIDIEITGAACVDELRTPLVPTG